MPELFEKIERKKRLQAKAVKKNRYSFSNKDRTTKENRDEDVRIKYKKRYLQHMLQKSEDEE